MEALNHRAEEREEDRLILKRSLYYAFVAYDTYIYKPAAVNTVKDLLYAHDQDDQSDLYPMFLNYAIFRDDLNKKFYVTFRGSTTATDFLVDGSTSPTDMFSYSSILTPCYVHSGFFSVVQSSFKDIKKNLQRNIPNGQSYTLLATGHSLGAASAQVFTWLYFADPINGLNLDKQIFTFAAPQILWSKPEKVSPFIASSTAPVPVIINVVNKDDIVPRLLGPRTTDLVAVYITAHLNKIVPGTPIQQYLQHILNAHGSIILNSYIPGQDETMVIPTTSGKELITLSRAEIVKEGAGVQPVNLPDRLSITTPLKDITVEAHYQANYLNGFVAHKLNAVQVSCVCCGEFQLLNFECSKLSGLDLT